MTKNELVKVVVGRTPHLSKKDMEFVVDIIFESMAQALQRGEPRARPGATPGRWTGR